MSRVSTTRLRTREAAAGLVAAGRRPHDLTVDLIYADIKQGSRTTINDELKLWKDEQAKVDVLNAALPPAVAKAMLVVWANAVEHGEKLFDRRRDELEDELTQTLDQNQVLTTENAKSQSEIAGLRGQLAERQQELDALRREYTREGVAKESAHVQIAELLQQLESLRSEFGHTLSATKAEYQQRINTLQSAMTVQEHGFRAEIGTATERLESVQKHVMLQVSEARDAHKRTEAQLVKTHQKNEQLSTENQEIRAQYASLAQLKNQMQAAYDTLASGVDQLRIERELFIQQIATTAGKISAQTEQIESLERRATGAESRLEAALKQPIKVRKSERLT